MNLHLIDGTNFMCRAYYATPPLTDKQGNPTNGIFGFLRIVGSLITQHPSDGFAIAFDHNKRKTDRFKEAEQIGIAYKGDRNTNPEHAKNIGMQIQAMRYICEAAGIRAFRKLRYEADDVIGSIAVQCKDAKQIIIHSRDKDFCQLLNKRVSIIAPTSNGKITITHENCESIYGIKPKQFVDWLALRGDDGIPGLPGVADKTAVMLIKEFGSVANLLKNRHKIKGNSRYAKVLRGEMEGTDISKTIKLLAMTVDVPVPTRVADYRLGEIKPELRKLLKQHGITANVQYFNQAGSDIVAGRGL